jgi:hypothetical protein
MRSGSLTLLTFSHVGLGLVALSHEAFIRQHRIYRYMTIGIHLNASFCKLFVKSPDQLVPGIGVTVLLKVRY